MIVDARSPQAQAVLGTTHPVVVVGSGPAGLAVVEGLLARGQRVLLVESGGAARDASRDELNRGEVVGEEAYRGLTGARARVLGGSGGLWAGQCLRLRPQDLAPRPWAGSAGWPLPYAELERWYPAAESFLGVSGRGYGPQRWADVAGLDPVDWGTPALEHDFTEITRRPDVGGQRRERLGRSRDVVVLEHATVVRVRLEGDRVRGVEVALPDGRRTDLAADRVVLATGAVENARLLMLSDPAGVGLGTGATHTGRHLQDHVMVTTAEVEPLQGIWLQDRYGHVRRGGSTLWPKVRLSDAVQREQGLLGAAVAVIHEHDHPLLHAASRLAASSPRRLLERGHRGAALRDLGTTVAGGPLLARAAVRRWTRGLGSGIPASRASLLVLQEQVADGGGRITLSGSRDPLGLPVAAVDWRTDTREIETSRAVTRWVADGLERCGAARVVPLAAMHDDDAWRRAAEDAFHPSGTTRMSDDPSGGVVDADGAVHGVHGLHVAGSSTFPVAGYANPTLTIVATALRLADVLADHLADDAARSLATAGVAAPAGQAAQAQLA